MRSLAHAFQSTGIILFMVSMAGSAIAQQEQAQQELDELVVVGSIQPINPIKLGSAITVLEREHIEASGSSYLFDVLRETAGLAVNSAAGSTQVRIRGAEGNHLLVIIDGVEANSSNGEFDFSSLATENVQRVEVLRGPQSGLYGSSATAGVINVITRSGDTQPGLKVNLEVGTLDSHRESIHAFGGNKHVSGSVLLMNQASAFDVSQLGDEKDNNNTRTASAKGHIVASNLLSFDATLRRTERKYDTDEFDFSGGPLQGLAFDTNGFVDNSELAYSLSTNLNFDNLLNKATYSKLDHKSEGSSFGGPANYGNEGSREKIALQSTLIFSDAASFTHRGSLFIENDDETYRNTFPTSAAQAEIQERTLLGYGIEYTAEINENVFLSASVRHNDNDKFENAATYRWTGVYLINPSSRLHASVGTGITNPSFFEQFGFDPGTFIGNEDLKPEKSEGWDIGFKQHFMKNALSIDLTYFDANLEDEISTLFDFGLGATTPLNDSAVSERKGLELTFSYSASDAFTLSGSYTRTNADQADGEEVRRPQNTASVQSSFFYHNGNGRVSIRAIYNGSMLDNDYRNYFTNGFMLERNRLESYSLLNVSTSYSFNDNIELYANVNNLLNEEYEEALSYGTPGIHGTFGMRLSF